MYKLPSSILWTEIDMKPTAAAIIPTSTNAALAITQSLNLNSQITKGSDLQLESTKENVQQNLTTSQRCHNLVRVVGWPWVPTVQSSLVKQTLSNENER